MPIEIGQRFDVFEILPNIRYSLNIGSHITANWTSDHLAYIQSQYGETVCALDDNLNEYNIPQDVKRVSSLVITKLPCHICGIKTDIACRNCELPVCEKCTVPYDQFSQVDYDLCTDCNDAHHD